MNRAGNGWDPAGNDRALLCINHEVCEDLGFVHPNGPTEYGPESTAARPTVEIDKEVAAHGVTVVEIARQGSTYQLNLNSPYNRRVTAATPCDITGPAKGSPMLATAFSPKGEKTRGTLNNCIQHPGENSASATDPTQFTSHWPDGGSARPRSATVIITRDDGGKVAV
jgi:uncharacterized protein